MKTQISRNSHRPARRFSGVYQQQGRMITDADWNEGMDVIKEGLRRVLGEAVISGIPRKGGLSLTKTAGSPLAIVPGSVTVDGLRAELVPPTLPQGSWSLANQPDFPSAPADPLTNYQIYADVWERTVDALEDPNLMDTGLHGADTCSRTQTMLQIKTAPAATDLSKTLLPVGDACLRLKLSKLSQAASACDPCATEIDVQEPSGNYLFRVEIHDLSLNASGKTCLTLKWSRDNGTEQYSLNSPDIPTSFKQGGWVYETFDDTTERLLGQHLAAGYTPGRNALSPAFPSGTFAADARVRQWDGYCILNLTDGTLVEGWDMGVQLGTGLDDNAHGKLSFGQGVFSVNLDLMWLELELKSHTFLAGDFWWGLVRFNNQPGDWILGTEHGSGGQPHGVLHHYLTLGYVDSTGQLKAQSEPELRRFSFPPLTDIEARDVGYDIPPGDKNTTVRSLMSNVPDWPATGAAPTNSNLRFVVDHLLRQLNASRLPYDATSQQAKWNQLLTSHSGIKSPITVQQAVDDLIAYLDTTDIPHQVSPCAYETGGQPSVRSLLGISGTKSSAEVLNSLLCTLQAIHLPLQKSNDPGTLAGTPGINTVQDALETLWGKITTGWVIPVRLGDLQNILDGFAASSAQDLILFLLPGQHQLKNPKDIQGKRNLTITGMSSASCSIVLSVDDGRTPLAWNLSAQSITMEDIGILISSPTTQVCLTATLLNSHRAYYQRTAPNASSGPPMVVAKSSLPNAYSYLSWIGNFMTDQITYYTSTEPNPLVESAKALGSGEISGLVTQLLSDPELANNGTTREDVVNHLADKLLALPIADRQTWGARGLGLLGSQSIAKAPAKATKKSTAAQPRVAKATALPRVVVNTMGDLFRSFSSATLDKSTLVSNLKAVVNTYTSFYGYGKSFGLELGWTDVEFRSNTLWGDMIINPSATQASSSSIQKVSSSISQPASGYGYLRMEGNSLQRAVTIIPAGKVSTEGVLTGTIPGYDNIAMSNNIFRQDGNCLAAVSIQAHGNHFPFGGTPANLGTLVLCSSCLVGNGCSQTAQLLIATRLKDQTQSAANRPTLVFAPLV